MHIDIWSDVVCPWCYLGARRLAAALERFAGGTELERFAGGTALERFAGGADVTVRWHAFELDPLAPAGATDLRPALERRYGTGAFDAMTARLVALGPADGIDYRFDLARRVNTFDAHRLVAWAADEPAGQGGIVERLFRAHFTEGADLSDHDVLAALAADAGLDPVVAAEVLAAGGFADDVRADEARARELDITGVPAFVVDDRVVIPGAQDVGTMVRVLDRVAARAG